MSPESVAKSVRNRAKNNQYTYGAVMSEETKRKISLATMGRKPTRENVEKWLKGVRKPILCTNIITGDTTHFDTVISAIKYFRMSPVSINRSLKQNKPYKSTYSFSYLPKT